VAEPATGIGDDVALVSLLPGSKRDDRRHPLSEARVTPTDRATTPCWPLPGATSASDSVNNLDPPTG